ncbi:sugar ABC transporter substrate-binding protein [Thermoclostridium stercorarium subsp. stercorarium DSM 8532]|uniref:Sugar ABC transporter substrate-binding protein n=3 Tax=Thermoclostridium stercorarium TaxID=1510 RepID=L7VQI8_THES1|nr:extracellular solute-binding protein [Thermoclostridium stercorarium]AGC67833.1 sugar ABC transporter substrate-binding protein [Thermoclostridium stercorarium subsp. stercorarium DSM 8532]AGI38873.1 ABC transporter periplasmic subunit [Thermoclostridium stercorarium subsp. stercorarium DSM 8532]ANW98243.1 sugar ABC transporter substrate-binding protein [Thermoclostridium stercorarium subsp. thermolacticum DSM 2910]ANX00776.1 sugar ABC transporter substrate-binding protein [Thermoclostridium
MKKTLPLVLVFVMVLSLLAGCGKSSITSGTSKTEQANASDNSSESTSSGEQELVDGRFTKTRKITVEVYDRGNEGGSKPEDNFYTDFIKEGVLRDHNIEVEFIPVPRWTEVDHLNNMLAAGEAPDICVTYSYPTIQAYANMGGVIDLAPYLEEYKPLLTNLWELLTDENIYYDQDPVTGTIWALEARLVRTQRINTFVREDWLKKLNMAEPTTLEEFENMLFAFKNNAKLLLGDDADKMIPFSISFDIGWRANNLLVSFVPDNVTDKELFIYGFDDRQIEWPGVKEGVRKLNEWYNAGLIWKDFALYKEGDTTEDNLIKAGYVGSFMHNWDYPYRDGENGIHGTLQRMIGPEAAFIAIDPFQNNAGKHKKVTSSTVDRKVFFPSTNKEPVASLLYLDWISKFENRKFLQIGEEGVTHEVLADGTIKLLSATGEKIMNSPNNLDYTITINGLELGDPSLTARSLALGYPGVDARYIERALYVGANDGFTPKKFNVGEIKAEEGMGQVLKEKRDVLLTKAVTCAPEEFDAVWERYFNDYLDAGGRAIQEERKLKFEQFYE